MDVEVELVLHNWVGREKQGEWIMCTKLGYPAKASSSPLDPAARAERAAPCSSGGLEWPYMKREGLFGSELKFRREAAWVQSTRRRGTMVS